MKTTQNIIVTLFFFLLISNTVNAQVEVKGTADILFKLRLTKSIDGIKENQYQDIEGNPFLFDGFHLGTLKLKDGGVYATMLRFDKYAGEIHFKKDTTIYAIAFPEKIESIKMDETLFIYSDYKKSESEPVSKIGSYFIVLIDNECKLLARKNISIQDAKPSNGILPAIPPKFIEKRDSYYIKVGKQPAIEIKNNKSLVYVFGTQNTVIEQFIKKEKISSKKMEDLMKLVNYYNTLE